jgi:hypothetical protein
MTPLARSRTAAKFRLLLGLVVAATCGAAFTPSIARADAVTDAKDLFDRGRAFRARGDCASAVPLFRNAFELYPDGLGSLRNLAECEEALGQFASARRVWLDLKRVLLRNDAPKYQGWDQDAEQAAARLASKVATLTIDMNVANPQGETLSGEGVEVTLNGERLAHNLVGTPLERDPGRYIIRAAGRRVVAREQTVELVGGQAKRVVLGVVVTLEPPQGDAGSHGEATKRTAAWVAMGVGAAGLIGAGVSAIVRQSAFGDLSGQGCKPQDAKYDCPLTAQMSTVQSAIDHGHTASTLVNVFITVGSVGLATGLVLLAIPPSRSTTGAALVLSPMGMSAVGSF